MARLYSFTRLLIFAAYFSTIILSAPFTVPCSSAVSSFSLLVSSSCSAVLTQIVQNGTEYNQCIQNAAAVNCMNPLVLMEQDARQTVAPPVLAPSSSCSLCDTATATLPNDCRTLLEYLMMAVTSQPVPSTLTTPNQIAAYHNVSFACGTGADPVLLTRLRYDTEINCQRRKNSENRTIVSNTIVGALDMRSLTQCGTCGVIPCVPSMYCGKNSLPEICAPGYYCPTTTEKYRCPAGYFCPSGTIRPVKCRAIAFGSCYEGARREVVWVPLLICILIFLGIGYIKYRAPYVPYLTRLFGRRGPSLVEETREMDGDGDDDMVSEDVRRNENDATSTPTTPTIVPSSPKLSPSVVHSNGLVVQFNHVRLVSGTNVRLTDATGTIRPGRFTAIIGGSGAGKTSLMNVLLGREKATEGTVRYSLYSDPNHELSPSLLGKIVGFVPQTDVMLRELTVEQLLYHSARSRLPITFNEEEVTERVESIIQKLGLSHLRETLIGGNAGEQGLSPGDRKRVNIGIELVAEPAALFLDEPTTGLDASSAMNVTKLIRETAEKGLTCVAVIHQPRGEIFRLLDEILILIPGGKVAYHGSARYALQYFKDLGYTCAPTANKTDFLLDLVSGALHRNGTYREDTVPNFAEVWETKKEHWYRTVETSAPPSPELGPRSTTAASTLTPAADPVSGTPTATVSPVATSSTIFSPRPGFLRQTYLNFRRGLLQRLKGNSLVIDLLVNLFGGVVIGIVACGGPLLIMPAPPQYKLTCPPGAETRCNAWIRLMIEPLTFYWTMTLSGLSVPAAVRTFGQEKETFWREAFSGSNTFAYYLGKLLADIPYFALTSYFFLAPMVAIAPFRGPVEGMYAICIVMVIFISSLSYALAYLFADSDAATLVGVIASLLLNLFGGFVPMLGDNAPWAFTRYTARAIVAVELDEGEEVGDLFNKLVPKPHQDPDWPQDLGILILFTVITHTLAFILLRRTNKARKGIL